MRRNRKIHKYTAALVLVCFLTALTGVSALAGHGCCGNCNHDMAHNPAGQQTVLVAQGCCPVETPVEPTCACTFQSSGEKTPQAYALTHVGQTGNDQQVQIGIIVAAIDCDQTPASSGAGSPVVEIRPRPGPIYLANQSFLC